MIPDFTARRYAWRGSGHRPVYVCLSVCPSHRVNTVSQRLNTSSNFFWAWYTPSLWLLSPSAVTQIRGTHQRRALNKRRLRKIRN